jgi:tRNA threonylcarbamoyl adenosine modification protein YeaZ
MKILALDFSTLRRSAAVLEIANGEAELICFADQEPQRAGSPFPLIEKLFTKISRAEIEGIAVGLGPGSYTGIRSSLALAQGWSLSRDIVGIGVSSADAIAWEMWNAGNHGSVEVVIDAQRNEVYSATYHLANGVGILHTRPLEIRSAPIGETRVIGPDATRWKPDAETVFPTGRAVGTLAAKLEFGPAERLEPIYLREPSFLKAPALSRS